MKTEHRIKSSAPVAYQVVILVPGIGQFGGSNPPSAYPYKFVGNFSCAQIDLRKARERELATLDKKWTSSGIEGKEPGGERDDTCDAGLVQKLESRCV